MSELLKMAAFKLGETARRVAVLAKEAETAGLRRLLAASSAVLNQQAAELRGDAGTLDGEPLTPAPSRAANRRGPGCARRASASGSRAFARLV